MTARADTDLMETGRLAQVSIQYVQQYCKLSRISYFQLVDDTVNNPPTVDKPNSSTLL